MGVLLRNQGWPCGINRLRRLRFQRAGAPEGASAAPAGKARKEGARRGVHLSPAGRRHPVAPGGGRGGGGRDAGPAPASPREMRPPPAGREWGGRKVWLPRVPPATSSISPTLTTMGARVPRAPD